MSKAHQDKPTQRHTDRTTVRLIQCQKAHVSNNTNFNDIFIGNKQYCHQLGLWKESQNNNTRKCEENFIRKYMSDILSQIVVPKFPCL